MGMQTRKWAFLECGSKRRERPNVRGDFYGVIRCSASKQRVFIGLLATANDVGIPTPSTRGVDSFERMDVCSLRRSRPCFKGT